MSLLMRSRVKVNLFISRKLLMDTYALSHFFFYGWKGGSYIHIISRSSQLIGGIVPPNFLIKLVLIAYILSIWNLISLYETILLAPPFPFGLFTYSERKLEISVIIDARTHNFLMRHPWTQSLRFKENQISFMSVC